MFEDAEHITFELFIVEAFKLLLLVRGLLHILITVLCAVFDLADDACQFIDWLAAFLHLLGLAGEVRQLIVGLFRLAYFDKD